MSTATVEAPLVHRTTVDEPEDAAHVVKQTPGKAATEVVMEARLYGYPVQALCGHTFIPQKDATRLPMCSKCKELVDAALASGNEGGSDRIEQ